jgi:hypothetical protein
VIFVVFFLLDAAFAALNAALYADSGQPISLGAAIFCGFGAVAQLVWMARR